MDQAEPLIIEVDYDPDQLRGIFRAAGAAGSSVWDRFRQAAASHEDFLFAADAISLPWPALLSLIREFAPQQKKWGFRLRPTAAAKPPIDRFLLQYQAVRHARTAPIDTITEEEIEERLRALGFTRRKLKPFQLRDLRRLLSLSNGANFSVPGAQRERGGGALSRRPEDGPALD